MSSRRRSTRPRAFLNCLELESRTNPTTVVTNVLQAGGNQLVLTFSGALNASPTLPTQSPTNVTNYRVEVPASNPQLVTQAASAVTISSATYNPATFQVTLNLASSLTAGSFYRVFVSGAPTTSADPGLVDATGAGLDGDYDDTPTGDFYGLFGYTNVGGTLTYTDSGGDTVNLSLTGSAGTLQTWRMLNGDFNAQRLAVQSGLPVGSIQQITVQGGTPATTTLTGTATFAPGNSIVVVPPINGSGTAFTYNLPSYFQLTPAPATPSPNPVVAAPSNLPYTIRVTQVVSDLEYLQSFSSAVNNVVGSPYYGWWLIIGGRSNGLHAFVQGSDRNFPPENQNQVLYVVNPNTFQVFSVPLTSTNIPASFLPSLYASNSQQTQDGDTFYLVGGYVSEQTGPNTYLPYVTRDTLTAFSVDGMIRALVEGGDVAALSGIQQISDPGLKVTGGELELLNGRAFLVVGQDFEGFYLSSFTQTYTDEIRSFNISYTKGVPGSLAISDYQAENDQVNFRRRDYNLSPIIQPNGDPALQVNGGVFTPGPRTEPTAGQGYLNPINITGVGGSTVGTYTQLFQQYSAPHFGLFSASTGAMYTTFLGGISLYSFDPTTGAVTADPQLPFVNDITSLVQLANGTTYEAMSTTQLPGLYGAVARWLQNPSLPTFDNGVIKFDELTGPTTLGYMYGGILATVPNRGPTGATNAVFKIELIPNAFAPVDQNAFPLYAVTAGPGGPGTVTVYKSDGTTATTASPFPDGNGSRAVVADVTGDGVADTVVTTGPGVPVQVVVLDGVTGGVVRAYLPFEAGFTGGAFVAAADVNGDGYADVAVSPDTTGGPRVIVYSGFDSTVFADFFGIADPNFRGGARVSYGDVNGDGVADLIVAAGTGGGPRVAIFDGTTLRPNTTPVRVVPDFFVFEQALRDGTFVSAGDFNKDGKDDLVFGGGPGGAPRVLVWDAATLLSSGPTAADASPLANFFAGSPDLRSGAVVAAKQLDHDGIADLVVAVSGPSGNKVNTYLGSTFTPSGAPPIATELDVFPGLLSGAFVG